MQSTVEQYFTKNPDSNIGDFIGTLSESYIEMFGSIEGKKAMVLGALLGGGMQATMNSLNSRAERKNTNKLIEAGNTMLSDFHNVFHEDIYLKDDSGNIQYTEKIIDGETIREPKIDNVKLLKKAKSLNEIEKLSAIYDVAVENNEKEKIRHIRDIMSTHLVKPFIVNDNLGLDVLEQHLKDSQELTNAAEREQVEKDDIIGEILDKAKKLKADYELFQNFGEDVFNLNNPKATAQEKVDFYNRLSMDYLNVKARQLFLTKEKEKATEEFRQVIKEHPVHANTALEDILSNGRLRNELADLDSRINLINKTYSRVTQELEDVKKQANAFWDNKSATKRFNTEISQKRQLEKDMEAEKAEVQRVTSELESAQTIEDLDSIEIPDIKSKIGLEQIKEQRRKELLEELSTDEETANQQDENLTEEELKKRKIEQAQFDSISKNFNVGEQITVQNAIVTGKLL
jgi:hypothetical protein